jgi:hypothetical protein
MEKEEQNRAEKTPHEWAEGPPVLPKQHLNYSAEGEDSKKQPETPELGLTIFDTTHEPDTNTTRGNRVWVLYNRVRVEIGSTRF